MSCSSGFRQPTKCFNMSNFSQFKVSIFVPNNDNPCYAVCTCSFTCHLGFQLFFPQVTIVHVVMLIQYLMLEINELVSQQILQLYSLSQEKLINPNIQTQF